MEDQHDSGQCSNDVQRRKDGENCEIVLSLGMVFQSYDHAYEYYNSYARGIGFSIRKQRLDKDKKSGLVKRREFCCSREGCYVKKNTPKKQRDSTRCGCSAMLEVKFVDFEKFVVSKFLEEHNHDFIPLASSHLLRSQRAIDPSQKKLITTMHESGLTQAQIWSYFSTQSGGPQKLNFIQSDCNNFVQKTRVDFLKRGDVLSLNEYFENKKKENDLFFSAFRTNMDNELTGFFFCDAKSRHDYAMFGDVLCFDTTFNTNKYNLLCAPFIGINNHGQTVLFGCGVINGESEDGCVWLFNKFLEAMGGKQPITIFTDQAAGIGNAISRVFHASDHRLCLWHIYQNAGKHLSAVYTNSEEFTKDFKSCIYEPETIEEFESCWEALLQNYGLRENSWLKELYALSGKWAQVYARSHFCAGVTTTQRSESINKLLKGYFNRKLILREFVVQYDKALVSRREKERIAEVVTKQSKPNLISTWKVEVEASKKYTRKIFKSFQVELGKLIDLKSLPLVSVDNATMSYKIVNLAFHTERLVTYVPSTQSISCTCRMFEFQGIICSHSLKVLRELNLKKLAPHYYLKRWTCEISNEVILDSFGKVVMCSNDPTYLTRYSELSHLTQNLVAKGLRNDQLYDLVKSGLIEMDENLKEVATNEQVDEDICEEVDLENVPKDPKITKSKCGGKGRKKNALEIRQPKKKTTSTKKVADPNKVPLFEASPSPLCAPIQETRQQGYEMFNHNLYDIGGQSGYPLMDYRSYMCSQGLNESHSQDPVDNANFVHNQPIMHSYDEGSIQNESHGHMRRLTFLDETTSTNRL